MGVKAIKWLQKQGWGGQGSEGQKGKWEKREWRMEVLRDRRVEGNEADGDRYTPHQERGLAD